MTNPEIRDYDELSVRIEGRADRGLSVSMISPQGTAGGDLRLRIGEKDLSEVIVSARRFRQIYQRKGPRDSLDPIREIGQSLFSSLFEGRRESLFRRCRLSASSKGFGLRLRLTVEDPQIASFPWEFVHDGEDFMCLAGYAPIVRMPWGLPVRAAPEKSLAQVRMLVVTADATHTNVEEDAQDLRRLTDTFHQFKLTVAPNVAIGHVPGVLAERQYEILQFVGFGTVPDGTEGRLALTAWRDEANAASERPTEPAFVDPEQLMAILPGNPGLRLVYLSADSTDLIAHGLAAACPCTVGIRGSIDVESCHAFSQGMLSGILSGLPLEAAVTRGRREIDMRLPGSRDWGMVVVYLQTEHGDLFRPPATRKDLSKGLPEIEAEVSTSDRSDEWKKAQGLLAIRRTNLEVLKQKAASFGDKVPQHMKSQIELTEEEVKKLTEQLEKL